MSRGISLHIGVDFIDKAHYNIDGFLPNCVNDARAMCQIADQQGFESYILKDENATSINLFSFLEEASSILLENDILFISFSGHGGYMKDKNGDEISGYDQTLLFYDKMIIDDQLAVEWTKFRPDVRIIFVADSCYSGSIIKSPYSSNTGSPFLLDTPDNLINETYKEHQKLYDGIFKNITPHLSVSIDCSIILLAACQEKEVAGGGGKLTGELSTFTQVLMECWNNGSFEGSYKDFYALIKYRMREHHIRQQPNLMVSGKNHPFFTSQIPFTI